MYGILTKKKLITLTISAFSLFILSIVLTFWIVPLVIDSQIDKNVRLERGTDQWHRFVNIPFNISLNVTFFEVTNADDVIKNSAKPNLKEKGPYVFDEVMRRTILSYDEENDTVTYKKNTQFYFNESRSGAGLTYEDTMDIINPGYMALMEMVREAAGALAPIAVKIIPGCMNVLFPEGLIMKNLPMKKLIFDGIKICDFKEPKCKVLGTINLCSYFLGISKTIEEVKNGDEHYVKFSFFSYKKQPDGIYEVNTGMTNINDVADILRWNNSTFTKTWGKDQNSCNSVGGTDGTMLPPHITEDTVLSTYSTDICRNVKAYYNGTGEYRGIEGYIFKTKPTLFYSDLANKCDDCFCVNGTLDINGQKNCYLDGVLDIKPCIGAPVLVSYPHFLYANETYLENLSGDIKPDVEQHELYMLVDKYTGVPLKAHKRVQMNIIIRPIDDFPAITSKLPRTILPLIWIDEGIDLPDSGIDMLNSLLYDTLSLVKILEWVFICTTLAVTIFAGTLLFWKHRRTER